MVWPFTRKRARKEHSYGLTWVTRQLAVGHAPMSQAQLDSLAEQGIDAIMNLCGEFCDLHEIEERQGFEVYYLPLADEEAPELKELEKALAWLDEAIYLGKKVLIHCRHGIGRTGTVLNAYLLRRGLGHRLAGRKLKKLRSKPSNFDQWWAIRKYGRKSGRLTVREPSLEFKHLVDLAPFFDDYERLTEMAEDLVAMDQDITGRCGREHDRCAGTPIRLSLAEAVYVAHSMDAELTSAKRLEVIDRAVAVARKERRTAKDVVGPDPEAGADPCLFDADAICPLQEDGCLLYGHRPLQCRTFELAEGQKTEFWENVLAPRLHKLSQELFFAFSGEFAPRSMSFALPDVVSGRYVQTFFHHLMAISGK